MSILPHLVLVKLDLLRASDVVFQGETASFLQETATFDLGGWHVGVWLMIVIDVIAVVILGLAIAYASRVWRGRKQDPRTVEASDAATWELYHPVKHTDRDRFR